MNSWLTNVYKAFIYVSGIMFLIALNTTGDTTINASITGYTTMIVSMLLIMSVILNGFTQNTKGTTTFQIISNLLITLGPFLLILGIIASLMYLLITYKTIISEGHVSSYYGTFSFLSSMLILVQMYLLNDGIDSEQFQKTNKISKITSSIFCLTAVLNTICVMILYVLLKYYTTDGYQNLL
jgi:hypothetical protein